ncbi:hypothetical protein [Pseudoroseomonas ludipueritiae]|uniref:Lipoprotein n=1 Tax=Pseudoroseomonas ludipueritiae TaxID=198093 RepID=A0ABR7R8Z2_9PROT|nr:hypothetical protein [Pseudoroseomonas ludipueritiae]MBC9178220.1 hypothetical protein [Pseudoroseomonas ludipueritiae]
MLIRAGLTLMLVTILAGCSGQFVNPLNSLSGVTVGSRYGGGTLGGIDNQREGGMRNLYGWR